MIKLNPVFKPIYTTNCRYILLTGGRGSGKSHAVSTFLCLLSYDKAQKTLFTRYTMTAAEISIIPEFKNKIEGLQVPQAFKINQSDIVNHVTKNEILFRGLKTSSGLQTANLKSIADVTCWCNDESEELVDEDLFDTIDLSIRSKNSQNRVILILNPSDKNHWIYRRWIDGSHKIVNIDGYNVEISTHPDVLHLHTTYLDNIGNLDASFIDIVGKMKTESPTIYGHKIIGQWRDANEGALFPKSKLKYYDELPKQFENVLAYIDTADEGNDFTAMIVGGILKNGDIYIIDILFSQSNSDVTIPQCVEMFKKNNVSYCRVESNSQGAMYARNLEQKSGKTQILRAVSTQNKFARIYNDSMFVVEKMYFSKQRSQMYESALTQMAEFTRDGKAKHDDVADAITGLAIFVRAIFKNKYL